MTFFDIPIPSEYLWIVTFPGKVYPLSRPRFQGGHAYQPLDNQRELRAFLEDHQLDIPFHGDLWLDCHFLTLDNRTGDCDNLLKAVCDGLQHARIIKNDKQIVGGTYQRGFSDTDHANIVLRSVERHVHGTRISN
jgi:Holliday junction resolvase RusA-like endonuclease